MSQACLIVAHDPWFIQLLRIYIEELGLRVIQVYDGQDVLPSVHEETPAVILIEEDLPGKVKILDLLRALRKDAVSRELPILLFFWHVQDFSQDLRQYGVTSLEAPITFDVLANAVRDAGVRIPAEIQARESLDKPVDSGKPPDRLSHKGEVA